MLHIFKGFITYVYAVIRSVQDLENSGMWDASATQIRVSTNLFECPHCKKLE